MSLSIPISTTYRVHWAASDGYTGHAYVNGAASGDGSICGRATKPAWGSYVIMRCSYCQRLAPDDLWVEPIITNNKEKKMAPAKKTAAPAPTVKKDSITPEHAQDIKILLDGVKKAAVEYGFCDEYDETIKKIVNKLNAPVTEKDWKRPQTHRFDISVRGGFYVEGWKGTLTDKARREFGDYLTEQMAKAVKEYEPFLARTTDIMVESHDFDDDTYIQGPFKSY